MSDNKLKGIKNGNCNVTACQKPGATFYNKSTEAYYCADCAEQINWPGGRAEVMELYGTPLLCEEERDIVQELADITLELMPTHPRYAEVTNRAYNTLTDLYLMKFEYECLKLTVEELEQEIREKSQTISNLHWANDTHQMGSA